MTLHGFPGIDRRFPLDGQRGAYLVENLRIAPDGSLVNRDGFKKLSSVPKKPRGFEATPSDIWTVCAGSLCRIDPSSGECDGTVLATLSTTTGDVSLVSYGSGLLMADGDTLKYIDPDSGNVSELDGYAPLIGKDWDPELCGESFEPLNLASAHARIGYILTEDAASVSLGDLIGVLSVDRVELNGSALPSDGYTLDSDARRVIADGTFGKGKLTLWLTLKEQSQDDTLASCTHVCGYGSGDGRVIFAFGASYGDGAGTKVFRSRPVTSEQSDESLRGYPDGLGSLYLPVGGVATVGEGGSVLAVCPFGGAALVFTARRTYVLPIISDEPDVELINHTVGCTAEKANVTVGDRLLTLMHDGLYEWRKRGSELTDYSVTRISDGLGSGSIFGTPTKAELFYSGISDELFVIGAGYATGKLPVYAVTSGVWYLFSGFTPQHMFNSDESNCYLSGANIFASDETESNDYSSTGKAVAITKTYRSGLLSAGEPGKLRRPLRIGVTATVGMAPLTLKLNDENDNTVESYSLVGETEEADYSSFSVRPRRVRGAFFGFTLTARELAPMRIFDLTLELGN